MDQILPVDCDGVGAEGDVGGGFVEEDFEVEGFLVHLELTQLPPPHLLYLIHPLHRHPPPLLSQPYLILPHSIPPHFYGRLVVV